MTARIGSLPALECGSRFETRQPRFQTLFHRMIALHRVLYGVPERSKKTVGVGEFRLCFAAPLVVGEWHKMLPLFRPSRVPERVVPCRRPVHTTIRVALRQALRLNQTAFWAAVGVTQSGGKPVSDAAKNADRTLLWLVFGPEAAAQHLFERLRSHGSTPRTSRRDLGRSRSMCSESPRQGGA